MEPSERDFNSREIAAWRSWREAGDPPLSKSSQDSLFRRYLQVGQCEALAKEWPEYRIGEIVAAAVSGEWPDRRRHHLQDLFTRNERRALSTFRASEEFLRDVLEATHKFVGQKLQRYLATGDVADLPPSWVLGPQNYARALEMLKGMGDPPLPPSDYAPDGVEVDAKGERKELTAEEAATILRQRRSK